MKIALITPAGARSRSGNRHTAVRWAEMLRLLGHSVRVSCVWDGRPADAMIALHARRSHASVAAFSGAASGAPLVVALTGTDLYRDIRTDRNARASLALAHRLVVLQDRGGASSLPPALEDPGDLSVGRKSRLAQAKGPPFRVAVLGHLREEKIRSARPSRSPISRTCRRSRWCTWARRFHRRWSGRPAASCGRAALSMARKRVPSKALDWLAGSRLLVISSRMEGGANVICEAAAAGVPVIASRISGNVGMLGAGYPGYYPLADERALARRIRRAARDPGYYASLKRLTAARRTLFRTAAEREGLRKLSRSSRAVSLRARAAPAPERSCGGRPRIRRSVAKP